MGEGRHQEDLMNPLFPVVIPPGVRPFLADHGERVIEREEKHDAGGNGATAPPEKHVPEVFPNPPVDHPQTEGKHAERHQYQIEKPLPAFHAVMKDRTGESRTVAP